VPTERNFVIRKYRASDRAMVRRLCCETGFLGNPIDPIFEDRELFANFLTGYYTDWEPESAFVLEAHDEVIGYLLGSRHPHRQQLYNVYQNLGLFLRGLTRYWRYTPASRRFVHWILACGWREVPAAPRRTAHFHINLLPEARNVASTRALMDAYLKYLHEHGEKRVYGQMVTFESRRGARMFERYGFRVINRAEISKYKRLHPEPVFLCTVIKDLEENNQLYAREL
jgi:ribosomal protein S18 acetylase RimI-like enzyme